MKLNKFLPLAIFAMLSASGGIFYSCDGTIGSDTCNYLNSTVASYYNSTFTNANATIYITTGTTGLGESTTGFINEVSYNTYLTALTNNPNQNSVDISALSALNTYDTPSYGSGNVELTSALANALGITSSTTGPIVGVEFSSASNLGGGDGAGAACTSPGNGSNSSTCYNGIITLSNAANFYYDNLGGSEVAGQYDFYAVVMHETNEILGSSSCISTGGPNLFNECPGSGTPAAVDLFRYNSAGNLALNSAACIGTSGCPGGAYFSYDGGTTNGANGFLYNTSSNGEDYADFAYQGCVVPHSIQDAITCGGSGVPSDQGLTILNDGGAEINILNAVGFDIAAPEPSTLGLLGVSLAVIAWRRRKTLFS